jgi:hypothetical protein
MVFAVHRLGCTPDRMMHWTEDADEFNFGLVYLDQCTMAEDKSLDWSSQIMVFLLLE